MVPTEDGWQCKNGCCFTPEGQFDSIKSLNEMKGNKTEAYSKQLRKDVIAAFKKMEVKYEHLRGIEVEKSGRYVVVRTDRPGILIGPQGSTVKGAGQQIGCQIKVMKY
jgi:ribosomal protein S3